MNKLTLKLWIVTTVLWYVAISEHPRNIGRMTIVVATHIIVALGITNDHAQAKMKVNHAKAVNINRNAMFVTGEFVQFRQYLTQAVMVELYILFLCEYGLAVRFSLL